MNLRSYGVCALAIVALFTSCKKTESNPNDNTETATELKAHAEDQNRVSGDMDNMTTEVSGALEGFASFSGRSQNTFQPCGITPSFDTAANTWKLTLTYNGNDCSNQYFRTGTVVISTPARTRWKNAGAAVTATLQSWRTTTGCVMEVVKE